MNEIQHKYEDFCKLEIEHVKEMNNLIQNAIDQYDNQIKVTSYMYSYDEIHVDYFGYKFAFTFYWINGKLYFRGKGKNVSGNKIDKEQKERNEIYNYVREVVKTVLVNT